MIGRSHPRTLVLAAALALGLGVLAQPLAAVASDGACSGSTGVTVIVDYQALGGGVVTRCAPGSPTSGFKALTAAGFSIAEVQNVPGFLCRIDGHPTKAQDACLNTPPASAFWSYWHASRGGEWVLSTEGGKTRKPPAGSVEGWSFSDDGRPGGGAPPPGVPPPARPATPRPATPKPATPRPATPRPATPRPATARPTSRASTPRPTAAPSSQAVASEPPTSSSSAATTGSATSTTEDASPSAEGSSSAIPSAIAVVDGTTSPEESAEPDPAAVASTGVPPLGTLLGIALVVVIGGAAFLATKRRPRADDSGG